MFDGAFKSSRKVNLSGKKKPAFVYSTSNGGATTATVAQASSKEELLQQSKLLREERMIHRKKTAASTKIQALIRRVIVTRRVRTRVFCEVEAELTTLASQFDLRTHPVPWTTLQPCIRKFLMAYGNHGYDRSSGLQLSREITSARFENVQNYITFTAMMSAIKGTKATNTNILAVDKDAAWFSQISRLLEVALRALMASNSSDMTPNALLVSTLTSPKSYEAAGEIESDRVLLTLSQRLAVSPRFSTFSIFQRLLASDTSGASTPLTSATHFFVAQVLRTTATSTMNATLKDQILYGFAKTVLLTPRSFQSPAMLSFVLA